MNPDNDEEIIPFLLQEAPPETYEPMEVFAQLAADCGLIRPGDKLDQNMMDFAFALVRRCANIADGYREVRSDSGGGKHIRSILGEP